MCIRDRPNSGPKKIILAKCTNSNTEDTTPPAEFYHKLLPEPTTVVGEFGVWKEKWIKEGPSSRPHNELHAFISCNPIIFPNMKKLLQIFTTRPISAATHERSFSTLKHLTNYLRNTSNQNRLTGACLLYTSRCV